MKTSPDKNPLDQSLRDVFQDFSLSPEEHQQVWDNVARQLATPARPTVGRGLLFRLGLPVAGLLGVLGGSWLLLAPPAAQPEAPVGVMTTQASRAPATTLPAAQIPVASQAVEEAEEPAQPAVAPGSAQASTSFAAAARAAVPAPEAEAEVREPVTVQEFSVVAAPKKVSELPTPTLPPAPVVKDTRKSSATMLGAQKRPDGKQPITDSAELDGSALEAASKSGRAHENDENVIKYRKPSHRLAEPTGVRGWFKRLKKKVQDLGA